MELCGERRKHRVLVVDDYPDLAEITCSLLDVLGQDSRMACTGREAIEVASRFDPEIVFLDLALPDINGFEVARTLRTRGASRPLYIIALTGCAEPRDREAAFAAGCHQYVVKPGSIGVLLQMAVQALAGDGPSQLDLSSRLRGSRKLDLSTWRSGRR